MSQYIIKINQAWQTFSQKLIGAHWVNLKVGSFVVNLKTITNSKLASELYEISDGPEKGRRGATPWTFISNELMKRRRDQADIYTYIKDFWDRGSPRKNDRCPLSRFIEINNEQFLTNLFSLFTCQKNLFMSMIACQNSLSICSN